MRALSALGRGDLMEALYWNPLVPLLLLGAVMAFLPRTRSVLRRIPLSVVAGAVLVDWIWVLYRSG